MEVQDNLIEESNHFSLVMKGKEAYFLSFSLPKRQRDSWTERAEFLQKKKSKEGVVEESRATHTDRCHWGWAGAEG